MIVKKKSNKIVSFIKENINVIKLVGIALASLIVLKYAILLFTPKPEIPAEYKIQLDMLTKANLDLIAKQKQIDSVIASYQSQIHDLDYAISNIQIKKTEIINHYQILGGKVNSYEPSQVDSFFKSRYSY